MKKLIIAIVLSGLAVNAYASDFCKQRVVERCDMSGTNCQLVVVCE